MLTPPLAYASGYCFPRKNVLAQHVRNSLATSRTWVAGVAESMLKQKLVSYAYGPLICTAHGNEGTFTRRNAT